MDNVIYILSGIILMGIVFLAIMIFMLWNKVKSIGDNSSAEQKIDSMQRNIGDEFSRIRTENFNSNKAFREEVSRSLEAMGNKVEAQNRANVENREKITEMLISIRDKNSENADRQNKVLESAIGKMQESNEKKLEEMRVTVDEKLTSTLTTRLDSSFKTVSEQLEKLYKSLGEMQTLSTGVTENVTALNRVLTNVKARGTWAEVQLQGILDQTIPNMYETNVATVPGSQERVEFAIRIPSSEKGESDILLPLDSKFPMEDYVRLTTAADSADAEAVKEARKALESRVLKEAKDVSKYIHVPNTTPFAIMYLATEGLYAEIASSRTGLPERIQREYNVMIAGPSTITALLNSLSMGFKTVAINEKANEVRELLSAIKTQYDKFDTLLDKAHKKITEAGKTIDDAKLRNNIIQKKLRTVEALDTQSAEKLLLDDFEFPVSDTEN